MRRVLNGLGGRCRESGRNRMGQNGTTKRSGQIGDLLAGSMEVICK